MREREDASSVQKAKAYGQLVQEVEHVLGLRPPEPIPDWECNNDMLKLFPEEADRYEARIQARIFVQSALTSPIHTEQHFGNPDTPFAITPDAVHTMHKQYHQYLRALPRHPTAPDQTFTLSHVVGAVKREYAKWQYLRDEQAALGEDTSGSERWVATYQTVYALASLAVLRDTKDGGE